MALWTAGGTTEEMGSVSALPGASTTKTGRPRNEKLRKAVYEIAESSAPTTARFIFYRAAALGIVPKTAAGYRSVQRLVALMRDEGVMPFSWIADNTRWVRAPRTHASLEDFLTESAQLYRRSLWDNAAERVEVWAESDSVAGVLVDVTAEYDVPLQVARGYSSLTFVYSAAKQIEEDGRPTFLYYFGDHDPSGLDIERCIRERLGQYAPESDITLVRVAVTPEDIERLDLPGSIKKATDTRSKHFVGEAVEIEAVPVETLREWCRNVIAHHVDEREVAVLRVAEESERRILSRFASEVAS